MMKQWGGVFVLILIVILPFNIFSEGHAREKKKMMIARLADTLSPDHPHTRTWTYFADKVREKTKGRIEIQVYHSGQLGRTKEIYLGIQSGTIEMAKLPTSFTGEWIPEGDLFDLPYLFQSREGLWRALQGPLGKNFFGQVYPRHNLVGVMWTDDGAGSIYTVNRPVRKPEDLAGLKIWVPPGAVHIQSIHEMGGIAATTALGEVYPALQQKVLDGGENSPVLFWTLKHWEVCKVYSLTEHFWVISPLLVNKKWWDGLPRDIQDEIGEAAREAERYFLKIYPGEENKAAIWVKNKGVQVITDVDKSAFEKRMQPVYDSFVKKYAFGQELLDRVTAAKNK